MWFDSTVEYLITNQRRSVCLRAASQCYGTPNCMKNVVIYTMEDYKVDVELPTFWVGYFLVPSEEVYIKNKDLIKSTLEEYYGVGINTLAIVGVEGPTKWWEDSLTNDMEDGFLHVEEAEFRYTDDACVENSVRGQYLDFSRVNYLNFHHCSEVDGSGSARHVRLPI